MGLRIDNDLKLEINLFRQDLCLKVQPRVNISPKHEWKNKLVSPTPLFTNFVSYRVLTIIALYYKGECCHYCSIQCSAMSGCHMIIWSRSDLLLTQFFVLIFPSVPLCDSCTSPDPGLVKQISPTFKENIDLYYKICPGVDIFLGLEMYLHSFIYRFLPKCLDIQKTEFSDL